MILIDTSLLIDHFRSRNRDETKLAILMRRDKKLAISMFTHYEIHKGIWPGQASFWDEFFSKFEIIPFDIACSRVAADIWKELRSERMNIDFLDLGIAATAVAHRMELATLNVKHFEQIDGLKLITEYRKGE